MLNKPYKWGFTSDIESVRIPKGLSEETVRIISAKKNEPEWCAIALQSTLAFHAHLIPARSREPSRCASYSTHRALPAPMPACRRLRLPLAMLSPRGASGSQARARATPLAPARRMLEFRLRAYKKWLTMEEPSWSDNTFPKIDYNDYYYYSEPKQKAGAAAPPAAPKPRCTSLLLPERYFNLHAACAPKHAFLCRLKPRERSSTRISTLFPPCIWQ